VTTVRVGAAVGIATLPDTAAGVGTDPAQSAGGTHKMGSDRGKPARLTCGRGDRDADSAR